MKHNAIKRINGRAKNHSRGRLQELPFLERPRGSQADVPAAMKERVNFLCPPRLLQAHLGRLAHIFDPVSSGVRVYAQRWTARDR